MCWTYLHVDTNKNDLGCVVSFINQINKYKQ